MGGRQIARTINGLGHWRRGTPGALVAGMKVRLSLVTGALAALATPALAQPAPPPVPPPAQVDTVAELEKDLDALFVAGGLTSDQAASRAGAASPTVQRRVAEVDEQLQISTQAYLTGVPQIGGTLSYTRNSYVAPYSIAFMGFNFNVPFLQNYWLAEAKINIPLSDYFYRYPKLVTAARTGLDAAKIERTSALADAGQDARSAYYEWVRAKLQVLVAQRQVADVQATLGQVRAQAEVQRLSRADLLRVESQEAQAEQTLAQLQNVSVLREEQLRILIDLTDDKPLAVGEDIRKDVTAPVELGLEDLMGHAMTHRLDVHQLDQGIAARDAQAQSEQSNYLPKLSLFGVADYANPNQRIFPQSDSFRGTWAVGAEITWTLNDSLTASTNVKKFAAQTDELRADRENLVRGARIQVLQAQQNVQLALHNLETTSKGLKSAEESYRVRKELLAADRATAVELVDSETDLTRARIDALNARVDLRVAMTQLVHALGDDAPRTDPATQQR